MVKLIIISTVILLIAIALMAVRIIVKKDGKFSSQHISQSKAMRRQGINCVNTQDYEMRQDNKLKINIKDL